MCEIASQVSVSVGCSFCLALYLKKKQLAGEYPKRDLDAKWIQRKLERLGLHVTTKLYPAEYGFEDMQMTIHETLEWLDELEDGINDQLKNSYYSMLNDLEGRVERATVDGPVFVGVNTYIISAELQIAG